MTEDRIDYNDDGVDDVVINGVETFRLERMNDASFWIKLYRKDKSDLVFRIEFLDEKIKVFCEED